tara:strand:+ start:44 stop:661 length:618 start_codon:yes stop_codon:yes gene_type:complete
MPYKNIEDARAYARRKYKRPKYQAYYKMYRLKHKEKRLAEYKVWWVKNKHTQNTEKHYFQRLFNKMRTRVQKHKNKGGVFEFKGWKDLQKHWHEQREKMGSRCPITRQPLTMIMQKQGTGTQLYTNLSPDRLFSSITYTKQNVLFTSAGWNLSKSRFKFYELPVYCGNQLAQRVFKILHERFPGGTDEWEQIDGVDWGEHREFYE